MTNQPRSGRRSREVRGGGRAPGRGSLGSWLGLAAIVAVAVVTIGAVLVGRNQATQVSPGASARLPPGVPTADPGGHYPAIGNIGCNEADDSSSRRHVHLEIRYGGEVRAVPANIGIRESCRYWIHTIASDGVVHVHAPAGKSFTLGDVFDVWGQVLSDRQVADRALESSEGVFVFVNREPFQGALRNVVLHDLDAIEVQVGTGPFDPLTYQFPSRLD